MSETLSLNKLEKLIELETQLRGEYQRQLDDKDATIAKLKKDKNCTAVVPVIKDAQNKSLAEIEKVISDMGLRAREGKIGMDELSGGTFTISNGGVYGSLMSTPILNPPQSGILGMHKIQKRPIAVGDDIKIRPMMYLAFSYDHRIIDGREAVSFLVKIKEIIEDPRRLILGI